MMVVSGQNYVNKPQYRTQNLKNELWGPKNVNKLGSFGNTGKGLTLAVTLAVTLGNVIIVNETARFHLQ